MKKLHFFIFSLFILVLISSCKEEISDNPAHLPEVLGCNAFNEDRILKNDPAKPIDYIVDCLISISNARISIEPGTVIVFNAGTGITVDGAGHLNAVGTAANPIVFKGELPNKGTWRGLYIESSSPLNELTFVQIDGAGGDRFNSNGDLGAIVVWANARLKMHHSTITNSASNGINATYTGSNLDFLNNTFENNNNYPLLINKSYIDKLDKNSNHMGNGENFIGVLCGGGEISSGITFKKLDVPYLIKSGSFNDFSINSNAVIEPGTRLEFENQTYLRINRNGSLKAIGTPVEPIIFTGFDKIAGSWTGIEIHFTTSPLNEFNNVIIEYAGQPSSNTALYLWANPRVKVENTTFKDIEGCAIYHGASNGSNFTQSNTTFINVGTEICE